MNIKKHITEHLERHGYQVSVNSLSRYISGSRKPSFLAAKAISEIVGSCPLIWLDPGKREQRESALSVYSKKIGGQVFFSPGRPKENTKEV